MKEPALAILMAGMALLIAGNLVLAETAGFAGLVIGTTLWGAHMALTQGIFARMIADSAPEELRATSFGAFWFVTGIAGLLASLGAGWLWDRQGSGATFLTSADKARSFMALPWVDWGNYWATGDSSSMAREPAKPLDDLGGRPKNDALRALAHLGPNGRGIDGALLDLEYQRIELIKFNLFDNNMTYEQFVKGRDGTGGPALKTWSEMRLPKGHPSYRDAGGDARQATSPDPKRSPSHDKAAVHDPGAGAGPRRLPGESEPR